MEEKMKVVEFKSLGLDEEKLIGAAMLAQQYARADYSHFKVGAAVGMRICDRLVIGDGCNVENVIYEVGHAEHGAVHRLAMLVSPGIRLRIYMVAVVLVAEKEDQHAVPCGLCRQWLREFGDDSMVIYGAKLNAEGRIWQVEVYTLGELLPYSFGPNNLGK